MTTVLAPNGSNTSRHSEGHLPHTRRPRTNPFIAVAYLRASTDEQALGMDAQRAAINAWADRQRISVAAWYEDLGVSGGAELEDRPGLLEALEAIKHIRAGVLVAHKADRVARDVYTSELVKRELRGGGATLALVEGISGDDPFSEMAATVMDAAARLERRMIQARTKAALAVKKAKGQRVGSVPFGFQLMPDGVHLEPNPKEQPALFRIIELRRQGLGGRRIAEVLTAEGYKPRGSGWNFGNLQVMADRLIAEAASDALIGGLFLGSRDLGTSEEHPSTKGEPIEAGCSNLLND